MENTNPQAMYEQAKQCFEDEHWKDALHLLDELSGGVAIQKDVMFMRAMCLARMGKIESAEILCDMLDIVAHDPRGQQLKPYIAQAQRDEKAKPKEKKKKQKIRIPKYLIPSVIAIAIVIPAVWFGATFVLNHIPEPVESAPAAITQRTVRFGKDFSTGKLTTRKWTYNVSAPVRGDNPWKGLGDALGNVIVPLGLELRLVLYQPMQTDLSGLRRLKANDLQTLDARQSGIDDVDLDDFAHLSGLRDLRLDDTKVTEAGFVKLKRMTSLWLLNAAGLKLGEQGWQIVLTMPYLRDIGVDRSDISDEVLIALCEKCPLLYFVSFDENPQLTDAGITETLKLQSLRHLFLSYTGITDKGLAQLQQAETLERLYLEGTGITDASMAGFQKMKRLIKLSVARTQITDAGLAELQKARRLEMLDVVACPYITEEGIAAFREALPDCELKTEGGVSDCPALWDEPGR